jgi:hypothetical protein
MAILLYGLLQLMDFECPFGIFKLFLFLLYLLPVFITESIANDVK